MLSGARPGRSGSNRRGLRVPRRHLIGLRVVEVKASAWLTTGAIDQARATLTERHFDGDDRLDLAVRASRCAVQLLCKDLHGIICGPSYGGDWRGQSPRLGDLAVLLNSHTSTKPPRLAVGWADC